MIPAWLCALALAQDADLDGVPDSVDTCPSIANPVQGLELGPAEAAPGLWRDGVDALVGNGAEVLGLTKGDPHQAGVARWRADPYTGVDVDVVVEWQTWSDLYLADADNQGGADFIGTYAFDIDLYIADGADGFVLGSALRTDLYDPSIAIADFDGDGDVELMAAGAIDYYSKGFWPFTTRFELFENLGGGVYVQDISVFWSPDRREPRIAATDLDADGDIDLAWVDAFLGTVGWLRNDGATFAYIVESVGPPNPSLLRLADMDQDGDQDLIVVDCTAGTIEWIEVGIGTFTEAASALVDCALDLAVGDADGDGDIDILVASATGTVWLEGPDLLAPQQLSVDPSVSVAWADLDGTGTLDAVVALEGTDEVTWYPALQPPDRDADGLCDADDACPLDPASPCLDSDGDGLSDADESALGTDSLVPDSDLDGLYDLAEALGLTDPTQADSDGDGLLDGVDPCPVGDDPDADGVCGALDVCPVDADPAQLDADLDGVGDACDRCNGVYDPVQGPVFDLPVAASLVPVGNVLIAADVDGDGLTDVLMSSDLHGMGTSWQRGDAALGFDPPTWIGDGFDAVRMADLDGDGDLDVVGARPSELQVMWIENLGGGLFAPEATIAVFAGPPDGLLATDLDTDGDLDLAVLVSDPAELHVLDALGGGVFDNAVAVAQFSASDSPNQLDAADLDGDGDPDIVVGGGSGTYTLWLLENFSGQLQDPVEIDEPRGYVALQDVDGDGTPDLIVLQSVLDNLVVYDNVGALTFGQGLSVGHVLTPSGLVVSDLDGDGDQDLVAIDAYNGELWWAVNDGSGAFELRRLVSQPTPFTNGLAAADLDGDGNEDLILAAPWGLYVAENVAADDMDADGICDPADPDADGDGFEAPLDCDDTDGDIHPGAPEIPGDGIDQDCDGVDDPGATTGPPVDTGVPDTDTDVIEDPMDPMDPKDAEPPESGCGCGTGAGLWPGWSLLIDRR